MQRHGLEIEVGEGGEQQRGGVVLRLGCRVTRTYGVDTGWQREDRAGHCGETRLHSGVQAVLGACLDVLFARSTVSYSSKDNESSP